MSERQYTFEELLELLGSKYEDITKILPEAYDAQWQRAPYPTSREDSGIRGTGGNSDPTQSIVMDGRRLALRQRVVDAQRALLIAYTELRGANTKLEHALEVWHGETDRRH